MKRRELKDSNSSDIAIIGLSGRFPGAENIGSFWEIIKEGQEAVTYYTREELLEKGVDPGLLNDPDYVFADGTVDSADSFDSSFFGYTPREADFMDPQHRVFLEECYSAIENAGYDPEKYQGEIGLFGGCSSNRYWIKNLSQHHEILNSLGELQTVVNNDKDFLTTRISYKLNLKGPSVNIQTACSTSLVAVHFACQSLITHQCDMAIGGGVYVKSPRGEGYIFEEGSIDSPTGHCRPFDKDANGTIFSEGVGVVVLKRLEDAISDRDSIIAVIKATAINNDGSLKVGYMAPGVSGQVKVISKALDLAGIDPETITYIETHGTGTKIGDPIEVEALKRVFSARTGKKNYCALGSVKANIGHLDAAAGVTGLIKAALVLKNQHLPPLVHFKEPNPELDLENSPFYINKELNKWDTGPLPRRAAVSSFGIGGTNGHAILEEWIPKPAEHSFKRFHLLPISAKSEGALQRMSDNLLSHLRQTTDNIADIAYTLQNGRKEFKNRGMLIWDDSDGDKPAFSEFPYFKGTQKLFDPRTIFMFTGQGSQYINMGRGLYEHFDTVRTIIDYADSLLTENHGFSLLATIFSNDEENNSEINKTSVAQPALFVVQYAVAHLLMEFGVMPHALTGHSIGEITAACLSGVFSFEDALNLVLWRGKLMQEQAPGSMLSINLPKEQVIPLIDDGVELSLINAPNFCVTSGSFDDIDKFEKKVLGIYPNSRLVRLKTSHAFHSKMMEPAIKPFLDVLKEIKFGRVNIPFISNVTGNWITNEAAVHPEYWASHIRSTVNFSDGISELLKDENSYFIEIGPGNTLSMLLSQFPVKTRINGQSTLRHPKQTFSDTDFFFNSLSSYWINGGNINWNNIYADEERYRIPLPTYPFERRKHWVDPKVPYNYHSLSKDASEVTNKVLDYGSEFTNSDSGSSDLFHSRPNMDNEFVTPESAVEKRVAAIWEELLGIRGIGVTDNFFFLGGHSLLASQIINRINEEFKAGLTIEQFFNFPTIGGLVDNGKFVEILKKDESFSPTLDYASTLPVSPSQERLWIINQIDNNTPAYNISFSKIMEGKLDKKIFFESLEMLFDRHKVLKSQFSDDENGPVVFFKKTCRINIAELDFSNLSGKKLEDKLQSFIKKTSRTRFDLSQCPLYRIFFINLGAEKAFFHITFHHLIFDGWSWGIFLKELKEIYNSFLKGGKVNLKPIEFDYFHYAQASRIQLNDQKYKEIGQYWKTKLDGISGQLNFPLDYKRKAISSGEGERVALDVGRERSGRIKEFCKKENVTLYMFYLSVFGFLLSRYSGDKDICLGSATANRPDSKLEKLIGLFINSIVLRLQIDEDISFSDFLRNTKQVSLEALSHQDLPFENLVEILNPERILNVNPIYQMMFAWQNAPRPPLGLEGIKTRRYFHKNGVSPLDLTFYAWEDDGSVVGEIEFSTDILKRSKIESLRENFLFLLDTIIDHTDIPLKDISVFSKHEKKRITEFNKTDQLVPEVLIQNLFEKNARKFQEKTAIHVISGGAGITYSDLEKQSNKLANYLQGKGFHQGSIAGVSMNRSEDMVIAVLGILKAGGTYLPLDPVFPSDRLLYMIEDSGAGFLLTEESVVSRYKGRDLIKIVYDIEQSQIAYESTDPPKIKTDINSLAYLIYTSGSTGKPKGVKVHHQAVVNFINSMSKVPGLSSEDRLLSVTTLSFDISVLELFLPLSQGATIVMADNEHIVDGEVLSKIIEEHNISILQATPSTWTILLESGWRGNKKLKALCGGEALQATLAKDLIGKVNSLWNMYGPTETTVWSSCELITDYEQILIGKPIDNTQFHILHNNQEQPVGSVGELCISGLGVSKGYHNREELAREKFYSWNGKIIYRTGDLGRFLENGKVELFGRTDNQIKLRGYRIEPGEIEFQLSQIKEVKEVIVKLEKLSESDERLVGYLNVTDSFKYNREKIIAFIGDNLPGYMIPSLFMIMKEFPRTLNGKIDRKALHVNQDYLYEEIEEEEKENEELSDAEKSIAKIWNDILKIKNIKKHQNFFDIGGNSLLAIRCLNVIKENLGLSLSFRELILNPTLEQLGLLIEKGKADENPSIQLVHLAETLNLSLTINQKRLWIIWKLQPDIPSYIIPTTYQLLGSLDCDIFQKSLDILFRRHHVLFSVMKEIDGEPYCDIIPSEVKITFVDYSVLPENDKRNKLKDLINEDAIKVFDLEKGPLYRCYLIKLSANEYYFHISIHHIIFDGWSWPVLVDDLDKIYNSLLYGQDVKIDNIEFQQYDFANWEKNNAEIIDQDKLIEFWSENLQGASPILNFPYDFPRREKPTGLGSYETIQLSDNLSERLREISKDEDSSLFSTMLSTFGLLMNKYSGEYDLNIGLPIAYRPHSSLEKIIGMFVNTVLVRLKFSDDSSCRELMKQTKEVALNAISNQALPFETIVEIIKPERFSNTNPLFQVGFAWQNNLNIPMKLDGIKSKRIAERDRTSNFDITFYLWENGKQIEGEIEYNTDILRRDTIIRLRDNFINMLNTFVENIDQPLVDISIVSENDKKLLAEFNSTEALIPDCLIHDLFEKQAERLPSKTAVISKNSSLTYSELHDQSNQLARYLISLGVGSGDIVGICIERSAEMLISILAVLKAGCCYLPIDPSFPDDRVKYMIEDSKAKLLISQNTLKDRFNEFSNTPLVYLDTDKEKIGRHDTLKPGLTLNQKSPAYTIYTSGSTGKPKGVMVYHNSVVNLIESMLLKPGIKEEDILLAVVTLSFDMSVFELFVPLSAGATIVVAGSEDTTDGASLIRLIDQHDISIIQATPSFWNLLLSNGWNGKRGMKALCGGEALTSGLVRQMLPKVGEFWNCYGPTETTVYSTCIHVTDPDAPILIGKPVNNTSIHILDSNNMQLPVGVIGEVCIGGSGVTQGYFNQPELTKEKFISYNDNRIIYKTGDLGRFLSDGNIELFGRSDNQIKLRGFRIEPGEIENLLTNLSHVNEAVVKIHQFEDNDSRLVAFLNVDTEFQLSKEDIIEYLSRLLPSYMIPSFIQAAEGFPRLPNGKINKKALVLDIDELNQVDEEALELLTGTQKDLMIIWQNILKVSSIRGSDDFFDVGGNSLLAIRIINNIKEQFGVRITFKELLLHPSIILLGNYIDSQMIVKHKSIDLVHLTDTRNLPLTINQKRLWLLWKLQPDIASYIIPYTYFLKGHLNQEIFRNSLQLLFDRHHIVFSKIKQIDGEPCCDIVPTEVNVEIIDYSKLDQAVKSKKVNEFIKLESNKIFDLNAGPLFRLYLIITNPDEFYFHISIHHIIFDGWSWPVFVNDLSNIYNSLLEGKKGSLEDLEFQQYDYAHWEKNSTAFTNESELVQFWKDNLKGASSVLNFPYDFQRKGLPSGRGSYEIIQLSKDLSAKLKRISQMENTSLFTTLLGSFGILLHKYSGQYDLNIGLPVAYRPHSKLENIFGMFVNTLVIRLKPEDYYSFKDFIRLTNESAMNAISHQELPFEKIVEIVNPERSSNTNPLFQVGFVWQNNLNIPLKLESIEGTRISTKERTSIFDITLYLWENGDHIEGEIEYAVDLLKPGTIIRIKDNLIHLLEQLTDQPDHRISEISWISQNEQAMLDEINNTDVAIPDCLIQEMFEKQSALLPDKTAVISENSELTYKELNDKANQLANHLRLLGATNGDIVGIAVERSAEMVISVLAVLKAGCCYLPVDPAFPEDRISYMLKDSNVKILLSQISLKDKFEKFVNIPVFIDKDWDEIKSKSIIKPDIKTNPQSLAYIIYTSGSTGRPKGVKVYHQSVVNLINSMSKTPGITEKDILLAVVTLSFDMSVFELFLPLSNGSTIVVGSHHDITDGKALTGLLNKHKITILQATPSLFNILLASGWEGKSDLKAFCGGEALTQNLVRQMLPKVGEFWNCYGPTETTVYATCMRVTDPDAPIVIGKPLDNTKIYILDKKNKILPPGVIGEVGIAGSCVTKGYNNLPELTGEKFITIENGLLTYKSGDLGRILEDGSIELFGRMDNQIKLRGFRIEPAEIETILSNIEGVIESVIKIHKFNDSDERLIAFLNVDPRFDTTKEQLSSFVSQKLPAYMVPSFFQVMEGFPRMPNGKINKKALLFDSRVLSQDLRKDQNSLTETQKIIAGIWKDVLKSSDFSITDNFFNVGGNSLLAISVFSKIESVFQIDLGLRTFFDSPRIRDLAETVDLVLIKLNKAKPISTKPDAQNRLVNGEI